jgi:hypothetical protein
MGVLLGVNGAGPDVLRYADFGLWVGEALPAPTMCPTFSGFTVCGGNCGDCVGTEICSGRSHLHPYGLCAPDQGDEVEGGCHAGSCKGGQSCFVFTVEPEAQPVADQHGLCLPPDTCQAVAANLPGGGKCM